MRKIENIFWTNNNDNSKNWTKYVCRAGNWKFDQYWPLFNTRFSWSKMLMHVIKYIIIGLSNNEIVSATTALLFGFIYFPSSGLNRTESLIRISLLFYCCCIQSMCTEKNTVKCVFMKRKKKWNLTHFYYTLDVKHRIYKHIHSSKWIERMKWKKHGHGLCFAW